MAGQVQYAQQTDDASRSTFSRIHGNDSTAYYKRDDGKDLPARPFDDIPAGKTEKAKYIVSTSQDVIGIQSLNAAIIRQPLSSYTLIRNNRHNFYII